VETRTKATVATAISKRTVRFKGSPLLNISASPHHCIKWAFKSADENPTVIVNRQQEIRRTEFRRAKAGSKGSFSCSSLVD
jgi:hypothetical protein